MNPTTRRLRLLTRASSPFAPTARTSRTPPPCRLRCYASAPPNPSSDHASPEPHKPTTSGSYTSILATLTLSAALGWALHASTAPTTPTVAPPGAFVSYTLADKHPLSPTSTIFTLRPTHPTTTLLDPSPLADPRALTSLQFKQPQLQIARAYTPLPPRLAPHQPDAEAAAAAAPEPDHPLRFLIRREPHGEVSSYLHRLPPGAEIELRGPSVDYAFPAEVSRVVFLAGGTGIAPAMQVAEKVGRRAGGPAVHVLWASREREECAGGVSDSPGLVGGRGAGWGWLGGWRGFGWGGGRREKGEEEGAAAMSAPDDEGSTAIVSQLAALKHAAAPGSLTIDYFDDAEGTFIRPSTVARLLQSPSSAGDAEIPGERLLIVSGPEGFVNYWAGPKQWVGGREVQGPLGGVLAGLDVDGWKVVKL